MIQSYRWVWFILLSAAYTALFTVSDFLHIPVQNWKDILISVLHWMPIFLSLIGPITLLAIHQTIFKITYPLITLCVSALAYYRVEFNFSMNPMILDIITSNDLKTTSDVITLPLLLFVAVSLLFALLIVKERAAIRLPLLPSSIVGSIAMAFTLYANLLPPMNRTLEKRLPFNVIHVTNTYLNNRQTIAKNRPHNFTSLSDDNQPKTIVVVIGESLRADHLQLNGYPRQTTPQLAAEGTLSFKNIMGRYSYTNAALPDLVTRATEQNSEIAYQERSFIDLFNESRFDSYFISNQDAETSYVYFTKEARKSKMVNTTKTQYSYEKWLDEDLLPYYSEYLNESSNEKKRLIVLHTIGSHFWFNAHYTKPFEVFKPVLRSKIPSQSTQEEMINSYDNTILYTDWFLQQLITPLKKQNAALFYFSDHGELLGEENKYLHGMTTESIEGEKALMNIAVLVWMSEEYKKTYPNKYQSAKENQDKECKADVIYHSILDLGGIKSDVIEPKMSLFQ